MIYNPEMFEDYPIIKLDETINIAEFDCGDDDLNDFILHEALAYKKQRIAEPYILVEKDNPEKALAYFTLSNDKVSVTDFATNSQFNKFRKKNFIREKYLRGYPSVKIGRLAVSKAFCGKGFGTHLLRFIKMNFLRDNKASCRFITVDAYNAAVPFYKKNGFDFLQQQDEQPTQTMYFDLMTIDIERIEYPPPLRRCSATTQKKTRRKRRVFFNPFGLTLA